MRFLILLMILSCTNPPVKPPPSEPITKPPKFTCPMVMIVNYTDRPWQKIDDMVLNSARKMCRVRYNRYLRAFVRKDNLHFNYACGPMTDCVLVRIRSPP
jgi:hypothetical protein